MFFWVTKGTAKSNSEQVLKTQEACFGLSSCHVVPTIGDQPSLVHVVNKLNRWPQTAAGSQNHDYGSSKRRVPAGPGAGGQAAAFL